MAAPQKFSVDVAIAFLLIFLVGGFVSFKDEQQEKLGGICYMEKMFSL